MGILDPVGYDDSSGELRELYNQICNDLDMAVPPNWALYLGARPDILRAFAAAINQLTNNSLPQLLIQLLMFSVSFTNLAEYCLQYHGYKILKLVEGLSFDELMELCRGESRAVLPEHFEVATKVAISLSQTKCSLDEAEFFRLTEAGFTREEIQDIVYVISFAHLFNTYTMIAEVPIEPEYRQREFQKPEA